MLLQRVKCNVGKISLYFMYNSPCLFNFKFNNAFIINQMSRTYNTIELSRIVLLNFSKFVFN